MFKKHCIGIFLISSAIAVSLFLLLLFFIHKSGAANSMIFTAVSIILFFILFYLPIRLFREILYTLNEIINSSVNCIFIKNSIGKYVLVNKALLDLYGIGNESEMTGKTDKQLATLDKITFDEATRCGLEDALIWKEKTTKYFNVNEFMKKDGTKNIFQVKKAPFNSGFIKNGILGLSIDITQRKKMEKELSEIRYRERQKIITDIHDIIGYTFTNLNMLLEAAITFRNDSKEMDKFLFLAKNHIQQSLLDARLTLYSLKNVDSPLHKGLESLKSLISIFTRSTGVNVNIRTSDIDVNILNRVLDQDLYRIFQEALTNAFRHGDATAVNIDFSISENNIKIIISDDGTGCENIVFGIGLQGIEERIKNKNGSIYIENQEKGFTLIIQMPLMNEAAISE